MFSIRLVSGTVRGVSSLTSSQFGSSVIPQPFPLVSTAYETKETASNIHSTNASRQLSYSSIHYRPSRITKVKKVDEVDISLPEKPKKPITPWIMFVRERKDEVLGRPGPKMSAPQMSIILAKEWQQIDKSKYEREYQRLHDEYERAVNEYEQSLTDEQRDQIQMAKDFKRDSKGMKQLRKTGPPTLPRNCANMYLHERSKGDDFKEMIKTQKVSQVFKEIFKEYRSMSETEKKRYLDMQDEDRSRFQHEFLVWYEGVQSNANLSKAAREQANVMRDRLRALGYI